MMKKEYKSTSKFTDNDILRYFYGEMPEDEKNTFEQALMLDKNLRKSYKELTFTLGTLPAQESAFQSPEPETLNTILAFANASIQKNTADVSQTQTAQDKPMKIRRFTPKPIVVGMAILLSAIVNFSGYSQYKQATHKKIQRDAQEWENLDNLEIHKLHRDITAIKEHRGAILPVDSTIYQVVNHEEHTTIILP